MSCQMYAIYVYKMKKMDVQALQNFIDLK